MTSATPAIDARPDPPAPAAGAVLPITRAHLLVAVAFLGLALLATAATSWQLVFPEFLEGSAEASFGRLAPVASNSLILGWLAIGLIGAAYSVVARGRPLWGGPLAGGALLLAATGTLAGLVSVVIGHNQGLLYLELPTWADAVVALALLAGALVVTRTAGDREALLASPAGWFVVAGSWWAALSFVVGGIPGLTGINTAIQSSFSAAALFFGGLLVLAVGLAYHVAASLAGTEPGDTRLSRLGFWSLVFVSGWIGPRLLVSGPTPDWLESIGAVFSIVLIVPVLVVLVDLGGILRDRWAAIRSLPEVQLGLLGAALLAVLPLHNLAQALRGSSTVIQFTSWNVAFELLLLYGVATAWLLAFAVHALRRTGPGRPVGWWLTVGGLGTALAATWMGGLQQGYTWAGGANSELAAVGDGFVNSVRPLEAWLWTRAIGVTVLAIGLALLAGRLLRPATAVDESPVDEPGPVEESVTPTPSPPVPLRVVVQGAVALFILAALATLAVPATDKPNNEASLLGDGRAFAEGTAERDGHAVYLAEGCWYCHTQQVRPVVADVGLGPVSQPGDYANDSPALLGHQRIGPDLMHIGSRLPLAEDGTVDLGAVKSALVAPDQNRSWSGMPSYRHLSPAELDDLARYLAALK